MKNARVVILALLAHFVLLPLLVYGGALVFPLDESLAIGLIMISTAASASIQIKKVQAAKGNLSQSVGLMFQSHSTESAAAVGASDEQALRRGMASLVGEQAGD